MHRLRQAANDMFTKRLINNFLQKLILATKSRRHKGKMRSIFSTLPAGMQVRTFAPVANRIFCSEAAENFS